MGAKLYIAEIPIAPWYRKRSPQSQLFERTFLKLKDTNKLALISLNQGFSDFMFRDHAHPVMDTTHIWADKLYENITIKAND